VLYRMLCIQRQWLYRSSLAIGFQLVGTFQTLAGNFSEIKGSYLSIPLTIST
jgi:hypothetical protein